MSKVKSMTLMIAMNKLHDMSETANKLNNEIESLTEKMFMDDCDLELDEIENLINKHEDEIEDLVNKMILIFKSLDENEDQKDELLGLISRYANARKFLLNLKNFGK